MWDFILTNGELEKLNLLFEKENGRRLVKDYLISFLKNHKINYADIIDAVQRTLNEKNRYDANDNNLFNICVNKDLIKHILSNKNAKFILFNTSSIFGNKGIQVENDKKINVDENTKSLDIFFGLAKNWAYNYK